MKLLKYYIIMLSLIKIPLLQEIKKKKDLIAVMLFFIVQYFFY